MLIFSRVAVDILGDSLPIEEWAIDIEILWRIRPARLDSSLHRLSIHQPLEMRWGGGGGGGGGGRGGAV